MDDISNSANYSPKEFTFKISKLGPIKTESNLTIKPLTIMCGPNNAGKTWAMYALYGFFNRFVSFTTLPDFNELVSNLVERGEYKWNMVAWLEKHEHEIIEIIHKGTKKRLPRIFNIDSDFLKEASFKLQIEPGDLIEKCKHKRFNFNLSIGREKNNALTIIKEQGENFAHLTLRVELPDLKYILSDVLMDFFLDLDRKEKVFLMPAERNGLHLFFKELAGARTALLHHITQPDIDVAKLMRDVITSKYAEPIADYIDWLNALHQTRKLKNTALHKSADQVRTIADGKFDVDQEGNIFFMPGVKTRNTGGAPRLGLHMASSTVKSLFGLWFYLEHEAKPGDTLMIDEPELNLHPDNQRKIAKLLVQLVNDGVKVIISTHSEFIIREINNLIMLSKDFSNKEGLIRKYNYQNDTFLSKENVAAYLFDRNCITPMEVNENEGIIALTFDNVINSLNTSSDEIYLSSLDSLEN